MASHILVLASLLYSVVHKSVIIMIKVMHTTLCNIIVIEVRSINSKCAVHSVNFGVCSFHFAVCSQSCRKSRFVGYLSDCALALSM